MITVTLKMPREAARKLLDGFARKDPKLQPLIDEFGVVGMAASQQTHSTVVRYPKGLEDGDCELCGKAIKPGELCEQTIVDDAVTFCCRECTEPESSEEYAEADEKTPAVEKRDFTGYDGDIRGDDYYDE